MLPARLPAAQSRVETQSTPSEVTGPSRGSRFRPGRGAAGGVGRDEDPAFAGDGDAERGRAAGDAAEVERAAELGDLPLPEVGLVEVRTLPPLELFEPPETATQREGEGQETAIRWVAPPPPSLTSLTDQAPGAAGRIGRDVDGAFVADRDAEALAAQETPFSDAARAGAELRVPLFQAALFRLDR